MIVLLGGTGYMGRQFVTALEQQGWPFVAPSRAEIDYTQFGPLMEFLKQTKPEFLINAAGYTGKPNVDACELHRHECLLGNAVLPGIVAEACAGAGVPWGHVSSGCIFTGALPDGDGFTENDAPNFTFHFIFPVASSTA